MLPHFIIIGAMKSGTTSLFEYLASHPETVPPSNKKEPMYFRTDADFSKGLDWYGGLFPSKKGRYAFEASTSYTVRQRHPNVPARIKSAVPHVKMVYLVRDPIDRALSQYVHQYATRWENESLHDAIRREPDYLDNGRYMFQLDAYLEHFPPEQIHIATLEDLKRDPASVVRKICSFLGIPFTFDESVFTQRFNTSDVKRRTTEMEIRLRDAAPHPLIASAIVRIMRRYRTPFERPELTADEEAYMMDQLRPDVERFRAFTGRSFSDWRPY